MRDRLAFAAGCMLLLAACADHSLTSTPMPAEPDPHFRLSAEQRSALRPGADPEALERLLARLPPSERERMLDFFRKDGPRAGIVAAADPEMQALLREAWSEARDGAIQPVAGERRSSLEAGAGLGITVILRPELDDPKAGAIVVREPGESADVIILGERTATAAQLFRAVGVLMESRARDGNPASGTLRLAVERAEIPAGVPGAAETERMVEAQFGATLDRLRRAERRILPGLGAVRSVNL